MVGDVVLAPFPYSDLSSAKIRPCLVLADVGMGDWALCEITSRQQSRPGDIELTQNDMRHGQLLRDSWARPGRLHTLNASLFGKTVGAVTHTKRAQVSTAVHPQTGEGPKAGARVFLDSRLRGDDGRHLPLAPSPLRPLPWNRPVSRPPPAVAPGCLRVKCYQMRPNETVFLPPAMPRS